MKTRHFLPFFLGQLALALTACAQAPEIQVSFQVVDESTAPVENAEVRTGYIRVQGGDRVIEGQTDEAGIFKFKGRPGEHSIPAKIEKDGYYDCKGRFSVARSIQGYAVNSDTEIKLILREIRNPVPMAAGRTQMDFPSAKGSYGFDLIERDWLPPHGVGEKADIMVHVDFVFNEWLDHDMQIKWEFVGEPNGIQPFDPIEESTFISPYLAPINGYEKEVSWRNRRFERDQWSSSMDRYSVENVNDLSASGDGRGQGRFFYLFRIRSEVDENGEIVGGHYGKIYGFGAMLRPDQDFPGGHHTGVIYLNPQEGDRNLEMDLEENLLTGLTRFWGPRRP